MADTDKPKWQPNERVDIGDMDFISDSRNTHHKAMNRALFGDGARTLSGFLFDTPSATSFRVTLGAGIFPEGLLNEHGQLVVDGASALSVSVAGLPNDTYTVWARFVFGDGDNANRVIWDPAQVPPAEVIQNVATREKGTWNIVLALLTPGPEWVPLWEIQLVSANLNASTITDKRVNVFEGDTAAVFIGATHTTVGTVSDWGGGLDRDEDRATNGVKDFERFTAMVRQKLQEIQHGDNLVDVPTFNFWEDTPDSLDNKLSLDGTLTKNITGTVGWEDGVQSVWGTGAVGVAIGNTVVNLTGGSNLQIDAAGTFTMNGGGTVTFNDGSVVDMNGLASGAGITLDGVAPKITLTSTDATAGPAVQQEDNVPSGPVQMRRIQRTGATGTDYFEELFDHDPASDGRWIWDIGDHGDILNGDWLWIAGGDVANPAMSLSLRALAGATGIMDLVLAGGLMPSAAGVVVTDGQIGASGNRWGDVFLVNQNLSGTLDVITGGTLDVNSGAVLALNGAFSTNVLPNGNGTLNLGAVGTRWLQIHADDISTFGPVTSGSDQIGSGSGDAYGEIHGNSVFAHSQLRSNSWSTITGNAWRVRKVINHHALTVSPDASPASPDHRSDIRDTAGQPGGAPGTDVSMFFMVDPGISATLVRFQIQFSIDAVGNDFTVNWSIRDKTHATQHASGSASSNGITLVTDTSGALSVAMASEEPIVIRVDAFSQADTRYVLVEALIIDFEYASLASALGAVTT